MNPCYRSAIVAGTLGALVVTCDDGKMSSPPANVLATLLNAGSTTSVATVVVVNTIGGAIYDTWIDRTSPLATQNDQSV
jgi:hypothetical protein